MFDTGKSSALNHLLRMPFFGFLLASANRNFLTTYVLSQFIGTFSEPRLQQCLFNFSVKLHWQTAMMKPFCVDIIGI
jgi:hypothetical protein